MQRPESAACRIINVKRKFEKRTWHEWKAKKKPYHEYVCMCAPKSHAFAKNVKRNREKCKSKKKILKKVANLKFGKLVKQQPHCAHFIFSASLPQFLATQSTTFILHVGHSIVNVSLPVLSGRNCVRVWHVAEIELGELIFTERQLILYCACVFDTNSIKIQLSKISNFLTNFL